LSNDFRADPIARENCNFHEKAFKSTN